MTTTLDIAQAYAANPELKARAEQEMSRLLARSATDLEFRGKLLSDPRQAIAEFTGKPVPESFNVRFVENKGGATVVLPDPVDPAAELSESELESVAGGITPAAASSWGCAASVLFIAAEVIEIVSD